MATALDDPSTIEDADFIGLHDRRETVSDHNGRAALAQSAKRLLDRLLGFGIERRGRLVEQNDRRVLQKRAGDRDALALSPESCMPCSPQGLS